MSGPDTNELSAEEEDRSREWLDKIKRQKELNGKKEERERADAK